MIIKTDYEGTCRRCDRHINISETIEYYKGEWICAECSEALFSKPNLKETFEEKMNKALARLTRIITKLSLEDYEKVDRGLIDSLDQVLKNIEEIERFVQ